MRLPEPLFPIVNRVMKALLRSPLHGLMSGNIMVIYYTGRKTGKLRSTPVRYLREGDAGVFCLTGAETGWWHNFVAPATVQLQLAGRRVTATAHALPDDADAKETALRRMLARFPGDAAYHGIALERGQAATEQQIHAAVARDVLVRFDFAPSHLPPSHLPPSHLPPSHLPSSRP